MKKYLIGVVVAGLLAIVPTYAHASTNFLNATLVKAVDILTEQVSLLRELRTVQTDEVKSETPASVTTRTNVERDEPKEGTLEWCVLDYEIRTTAASNLYAECLTNNKLRAPLERWTEDKRKAEDARCERLYKKNMKYAGDQFLLCLNGLDWGL